MPGQLPITLPPPPDLPNMPDVSDTLSRYLRTFSLWCKQGFADKVSVSTAVSGVMLQTSDVPPEVYQLGVEAGGVATLTPIALGSGVAGAEVPIANAPDLTAYLPLTGGALGGSLSVTGNVSATGTVSAHTVSATTVSATGNMSAGTVSATGNLTVTGNGVFAGTLQSNTYLSTIADPVNNYSYVGFFDNDGVTRHGYVGSVSGIRLESVNGQSIVLNDSGGVTINTVATAIGYYATGTAINQNVFQVAGVLVQTTGGPFWLQAPQSNDCFMTFLINGQYGVNFGLNANGGLYKGGWSRGANYDRIWSSQDFANPACDYRIKEDIKPLASTWDDIKSLKPISYRHKEFKAKTGGIPLIEADDRERWGFIAHELQADLIETAATGKKDIEDRLQAPDLMAVVAALTRTVQELQTRVEVLEAA